MRSDERGYIVVETIGSFVLFILLVISILSLVNIAALQARVHYAMTQAAQTLSMYSYVLEVTGAADHLENLNREAGRVRKEADEFKTEINGILDGIETESLGDIGKHGEAAVGRVYGWAENTIDDPKETIRLLLDYGLDEAKNALVASFIIRPLVGRYLGNGGMTGDEYLKSVSVIDGLDGLNFYDFDLFILSSTGANDSVLIDANGDVKLVVRYEVDYSFGALPLPFPKLSITQTVRTKAWLGGSGEGYKP